MAAYLGPERDDDAGHRYEQLKIGKDLTRPNRPSDDGSTRSWKNAR
jgi:hypothetical protein